jgi:hypothetical protein
MHIAKKIEVKKKTMTPLEQPETRNSNSITSGNENRLQNDTSMKITLHKHHRRPD